MTLALSRVSWRVALYGAALVIASVCLFPYAVMVLTALKPNAELAGQQAWIPQHWNWHILIHIWSQPGLLQDLANSAIIAGGVTGLTLLCAVPAAYVLARGEFAGRQAFLDIILITQMMSPVVVIIPLFTLFASLNLLGTYEGVIVIATAFVMPFCIWLLVGFFRGVPKALEDAARLDGCGRLRTLWFLILPNSIPGLAATTVYAFLYGWNDFIISLTFLSGTPKKWPITVGVFQNVGQWFVNWQPLMLTAVIGTLPVLALFSIVQRQLDRGFSSMVAD